MKNALMHVLTRKSPAPGLLMLVGASTLAGCAAVGNMLNPEPAQATRVDWDWEAPQFSTEAEAGKKVFIEWNDAPVVPEISGSIKQDLAKILKERHNLTIVDKSAEADYLVQLFLRYFNGSAAADRGAAVVAAAGKVGGGRPGWIIPGSGPISDGDPVPRIADLSKGSNKEWVLLIDVAVGEKGGDDSQPDALVLRRGRLMGYLPCKGLEHEDVLWYFKYGKAYPRPPAPVEGVPAPPFEKPDPTLPAKELLDALLLGILPI